MTTIPEIGRDICIDFDAEMARMFAEFDRESAESIDDIAPAPAATVEIAIAIEVVPKPQVVFSTPVKYHPAYLWFALVNAVAMSALYGFVFVKFKGKELLYFWGFLTSLLTLVVVFALLFIPKRFELLSNNTLRIKSTCFTLLSFRNIETAIARPSYLVDRDRPSLPLATCRKHRVLVCRANGDGWDIWVSPKDVDGFADAVIQAA